MSDSKTEKTIDVVPCPSCNHTVKEQRFAVMVTGELHKEFPHLKNWCGTEAEAQAKAAELRAIDEFVVDSELAAATQPTETRPPQHEHPEACPVCDSPYCEHDEAEQNLIKKAWESGYAARAAAPVEPPTCQDCEEVRKRFLCPKHDPEDTEYEAATELVEPAPRPQDEECDCGEHGNNGTLDHHGIRVRVRSKNFNAYACANHLQNYLGNGWHILAAASSPVARPRVKAHCMVCRQLKEVPSEVVNVCDDCAKKLANALLGRI